MKTDELVAMLANGDVAVAPRALERRLLVGISAGSIGAVVLMVTLLGVRPDLLAAAHQPMFWVKSLFAASLALAALVTAARLSRPGVLLGRAPVAVVSPVLAMWALGALVLLAAVPDQRANLLFGDTWNDCPLLIALLALPIFVGTLWAMGGLAPTRLRLAGAASGLLSGAIATLVYCLHCPEMAAPFVAVWYVLGMALPTVLGALLGPRLLRW
jgi:hypothetical protein